MKKANSFKYLLHSTVALSLMASLSTAPAIGQDDDAARDDEASEDDNVDVIIVSARRKDENIQDVPISISVFNEEQLRLDRIDNFDDLATRIPNLAFGPTGNGPFTSQSITVRGISGGGTTGVYIDATPVGENWRPRLFDIERVEILRGPQGTLFGVGSMGGTIIYTSKKADPNEFSGAVRGTVATVKEGGQNYVIDGAVNIPLVEDELGLRVSAFYEDLTGTLEKTVLEPEPGAPSLIEDIDQRLSYGYNVVLEWTPTSNFYLRPRFLYQRFSLGDQTFRDSSPSNHAFTRRFDVREEASDWFWLASVEGGIRLDFGEIVIQSSKLERSTWEREDFTTFADLLFDQIAGSIVQAHGTGSQWTQEGKFVSDFDSPFQITLGAFYNRINDFGFWPPTIVLGLGDFVGDPGNDNAFELFANTRTRSWAVFGEASYALTDRLIVTAGGRYFKHDTTFTIERSGAFAGIDPPPATTRDDGFTPRFSLAWTATDDLTIYAQAAQGFRLGGTNTPNPANQTPECEAAAMEQFGTTPDKWDPDTLWNYEGGVKAQLLNNKVGMNASVFYVDWTGLPQTVLIPECPGAFTTNTAKAVSKGFEYELRVQPLDGLTGFVGVGYVDSEITDAGASGVPTGPFIQVPKWTLNSNLQYTHSVSNLGDLYARATYRYVGASRGRLSGTTRPEYALIGLRAGLNLDRVEFGVYADNLTNRQVNFGRIAPLSIETVPRFVSNRPRTIGADIRYSF